MSYLGVWACVIGTVYVINEISKNIIATIFGIIDLANSESDNENKEEEEVPEHVKAMYS